MTIDRPFRSRDRSKAPLLLTRAGSASSEIVLIVGPSSSLPEFVGRGRVEKMIEDDDEDEDDLKDRTTRSSAEFPKVSCRTLGRGPRHPGRKCEPRAVER